MRLRARVQKRVRLLDSLRRSEVVRNFVQDKIDEFAAYEPGYSFLHGYRSSIDRNRRLPG